METKIFNGLLIFDDDKNAGVCSSMKFYKIDEQTAVGEDGYIYQIIPCNEVFNSDGEIIAEFIPIIIYLDEENKTALNYSEIGEFKENILSYIYCEFDDMSYNIVASKFSNEDLLNILISINKNKAECDSIILKEYSLILKDAVDKFKHGQIIEFHEGSCAWLYECKYISNIETLKRLLEENDFPYYENEYGLYAIFDDVDKADRLASEADKETKKN